MEVILGVDVGGTTMAAGVVTPSGEVLVDQQRPTHHAGRGRVRGQGAGWARAAPLCGRMGWGWMAG